MENYFQDDILLSNLLLDLENPRHDILGNQREAYRFMLDNQGDKLINLANDIIQEGLNPSELPIVVPYEKDGTKFVVLEGNRRISALRILLDPKLSEATTNKAIITQFKKLSKDADGKIPSKLRCVVFKDRDSAVRWIRLKHTGENQGVGTVRWDAKEIQRFNERFGKTSLSLQILEYVSEKANLDEQTRDNINDIAITNLDRLISDPYVRNSIGINTKDGKLVSSFPEKEILKPLVKIVSDLANKKINVNNIYYKKDRINYIESFPKTALPTPNQILKTPTELINNNVTSSTSAPKKASKMLPLKRKKLIPTHLKLSINTPKTNEIYRELKMLDVEDFRNAVSILFRVFVEFSIDSYLDKNHISYANLEDKLVKKIQLVANHMKANNIMNQKEMKPVLTCISNPNSLLSTNTLNAYVHNKNFLPIPNDLKTTWDNLQPFIEKIWE